MPDPVRSGLCPCPPPSPPVYSIERLTRLVSSISSTRFSRSRSARRWSCIYSIEVFAIPRYFAGMGERFGFLPRSFKPTGPGSIWFHAVSVGEVLSAVELIRRVRHSPAARRNFRVRRHSRRTGGCRAKAGGAREWRFLRPPRLPVCYSTCPAADSSGRGGRARNRNLAESLPGIEARGSQPDGRQRPDFRSGAAPVQALERIFQACSALAGCDLGPERAGSRAVPDGRRTAGACPRGRKSKVRLHAATSSRGALSGR